VIIQFNSAAGMHCKLSGCRRHAQFEVMAVKFGEAFSSCPFGCFVLIYVDVRDGKLASFGID
jgi:hypothetical protein